MRRPHLSGPCSLLAAIVASGGLVACGADKQPTTRGPAEATYTATNADPVSDVRDEDCRPPSRAAIASRARDVRVAGQDGRGKRRPRTLEVAREITLSCLRWSRWGRAEARATGIAKELDCQPNCAAGGVTERRARLVVSGLERCRGRWYYSRASLMYTGDEGAKPVSVFTVVPCVQ